MKTETPGLKGRTKQPFVVSFCTHKKEYERQNGLLSLWRAYGRDSGYSIAFETKPLVDMLNHEAEHHRHDRGGMAVVCDTSEEVFKTEFKDLIDAMNEDVPRLLKYEEGPFTLLQSVFMRSIPRYKHQGFFEEQEVRIVISPISDELFERSKAAGGRDRRESKKIKIQGLSGSLHCSF